MRKRSEIKAQYVTYLMDKCNLTYNTADTYLNELNHVDLFMQSAGVISESLFEIRSMHTLEAIRDFALNSQEFTEMSIAHRKNPGFSLRHYYNFAAHNKAFTHNWEDR